MVDVSGIFLGLRFFLDEQSSHIGGQGRGEADGFFCDRMKKFQARRVQSLAVDALLGATVQLIA